MSDASNRRNFRRIPIDSAIELWTEKQSWNGVLVNQSIGGVGLLLETTPELKAGDEIWARYDETEAYGFIRQVRANGGGAYIGISWEQQEEAKSASNIQSERNRKSEATFFISGPVEVVCRTCEKDESGNVTFELWDGAEFSTPENHVSLRAVAERERLLATNVDQLHLLSKLYKLELADSPELALQRVIDFEFAL